MIKYSGIYESSTPPTSTKALWVDGGVLKIYKNGSWRPVDDPKSKLTIDSILKAGSTNPVENKAIYSRFIGVDKDIEVNRNNITDLTRRTDEIDGIAKGAEELTKVNEKRINSIEALAKANEAKSQDNASKIFTLNYKVADVKNTADGNKHDIESLTDRVIKPLESKVSQLQELNVVYPNNIRNLTTESTVAEVKEAFIPAIGGSAGVVNTPHVGYLIKGAAYEDSSEDDPEYGPDSTIISVDIIKTDNKDYYKFIYVDNNTAIISVTVDLVNYRLIDKSTLANIEANSKVGTLRDLYISAGAKYNEATGYYELNGLTDITEEQMRVIYEKTWGWWIGLPNLSGFGDSSARTNIPCPDYKRTYYQSNVNISSSFATSSGIDNLEVLNFRPINYPNEGFVKLSISSMSWLCQGNKKPITVMGILDIGKVKPPDNLNIGGNIKSINIKNLSENIKFYGSTVLSKESVLFMINNSAATSAITIGLQQAVYDVMKDDADIIAALAEKTNITLIQNT